MRKADVVGVRNDGDAAELEHPHVHLVPRWEGDGLAMWPAAPAPGAELAAIHAALCPGTGREPVETPTRAAQDGRAPTSGRASR